MRQLESLRAGRITHTGLRDVLNCQRVRVAQSRQNNTHRFKRRFELRQLESLRAGRITHTHTGLRDVLNCETVRVAQSRQKYTHRFKRRFQGFKVLFSFWPWGLEIEVTFAHDIPYEQVHEFY